MNIEGVRVNGAGRVQWPPNWTWNATLPERQFSDFDLWTIRSGKGTLETDDGILPIQTGDCFVLRPNSRYIGRSGAEDPASVSYVHFDYLDNRAQTVTPEPEYWPRLHRHMADMQFFGTLLDRIVDACRNNEASSHCWLTAALAEVSRQDQHPDLTGRDLENYQAIEALCSKIDQNPGHNLTTATAARIISCTPQHFNILFKRYKGVSFHRYLIQARLAAARTELAFSPLPVYLIADRLGYRDPAYFSRQFMDHTGLSPSAYRDQFQHPE